MCQYARRLCDASNQTESVLALLDAACSSYLAAINALHLAGPQYTWVTVASMESDSEEVIDRGEDLVIALLYRIIGHVRTVHLIPENLSLLFASGPNDES